MSNWGQSEICVAAVVIPLGTPLPPPLCLSDFYHGFFGLSPSVTHLIKHCFSKIAPGKIERYDHHAITTEEMAK
jgi:hypothetical protein